MNPVTGDITTAKQGYIIQQVNAQGVMGSGLAKAIRAKWPHAYDDYAALYKAQGGRLFLGQIIIVKVGDGLFVVNIVGQDKYGRDGQQYTSYAALEVGLLTMRKRMASEAELAAPLILHTPRIGCGLGGGKWETVEAIIQKTCHDMDIYLWDLNQN